MNEAQTQGMPRKDEGQKQPCKGGMKVSAVGRGTSEEAAINDAYDRALKQAELGCSRRRCGPDLKCSYVQSDSEQGIVEANEDSTPILYSVTVTTIGRCRCPGDE